MNKLSLLKAAVLTVMMAALAVSCDEKPTETAVESISISPKADTLVVGDTLVFSVTVLPETATNKEYTLFSSNPELVEIDGSAIVALKKGTVVISATSKDGTKMDTAEIVIEEKEEDEPQPPVQDPLDFTVEFSQVTYDNFIIRVSPNSETARYWVWCAEASELDGLTDDEIIAQDKELIQMMIEEYGAEENVELTIEDILSVYTYTGSQDMNISLLLFEEPLKPATKYYVYMYGMEIDGTVTSEVFTFDQSTASRYGSDDQYDCILDFEEGRYKDYKGDGTNWSVILRSGADELALNLSPKTAGQLEGTYSSEDETADPYNSYFDYMYTATGRGMFAFSDMEVTISKTGDEYSILCTGELETGVTVKLKYDGPLTFIENTNPNPDPDPNPDPGPGSGEEELMEIQFSSADYYPAGKDICLNLYIDGFPTMIYFTPADLSDWTGTYSEENDNLGMYFVMHSDLNSGSADNLVMVIAKDGDNYNISGSFEMDGTDPLLKVEFTYSGPVPECVD